MSDENTEVSSVEIPQPTETGFEAGEEAEEATIEEAEGTEGYASAEAGEAEQNEFDAEYATESGGGTTAALLFQTQAQAQEVVIGNDDRIQITNTMNIPWKRICSLKIKDAYGSNWVGTGVLIGPRCVATAAHCVWIKGKWAREIEIIPGRNGSDKPFGSVISKEFKAVSGYTAENKRDFDYAAIILPQRLGDTLGYFGFIDTTTFNTVGKWVNLAGYPGDKPPGTLWFNARTVDSATDNVLTYQIDTAGGQSGAGVYVHYPASATKPARRYLVGIHTNGHPKGNSATRINAAVYNNLKTWSKL